MRKLPYLLIPLLALACERDPVTPPAGGQQRPAFDQQSDPASPEQSAVSWTEETAQRWETADPTQDLIVRHFNAEDLDLCGGATPFPVIEIQWISTPLANQRTAFSDDMPAYVYHRSEVPPPSDWQNLSPEFCSALATKWIYRGTTRFRQHDNDFDLSGVRTNAITAQFTGTLYDHSGQGHAYRDFCAWNTRPSSLEHPGPAGHEWQRCTISIK